MDRHHDMQLRTCALKNEIQYRRVITDIYKPSHAQYILIPCRSHDWPEFSSDCRRAAEEVKIYNYVVCNINVRTPTSTSTCTSLPQEIQPVLFRGDPLPPPARPRVHTAGSLPPRTTHGWTGAHESRGLPWLSCPQLHSYSVTSWPLPWVNNVSMCRLAALYQPPPPCVVQCMDLFIALDSRSQGRS